MKSSQATTLLAAAVAAALLPGCAVVREQQTVGSYIGDTTLTARGVPGVADVRNDIVVSV